MGKRGIKPQPAAIAKQKGVYQPVRHKDKVADTTSKLQWVNNGFPMPPEHLNEAAQEVWMQQLSEAQKLYGYISFLDLKVFAEYCYVCSEMDYLKEQSFERVTTDDKGVVRINPLYTELNKRRKDFMRLSNEFGFTPSSRSGVDLQPNNETKKEDKYKTF